jgi:type IV pilus assembly protein PilN
VEDLQTDRNVPVYLLNELVRQTPEGVYLTSVRQTGQVVAITGVAQTPERVAEYLRDALYNSTWLERPELGEIKASTVNANSREQRRLFDFALRVTIKRQQNTPATAAPAAQPGKPAAGKAG